MSAPEIDGLRLDLQPAAEAVPVAAAEVARYAERAGMGAQGCFQLQVVIAEVLNNVVEHGGGAGAGERVRIRGRAVGTHLRLRVEHRGIVFEPPRGRVFPAALAEGGRGWPIVQSWCDAVDLRADHRGVLLVLEKTIA